MLKEKSTKTRGPQGFSFWPIAKYHQGILWDITLRLALSCFCMLSIFTQAMSLLNRPMVVYLVNSLAY